VFPTGIVLALTVEPLVIVVWASAVMLKKMKPNRNRKFLFLFLLTEKEGFKWLSLSWKKEDSFGRKLLKVLQIKVKPTIKTCIKV